MPSRKSLRKPPFSPRNSCFVKFHGPKRQPDRERCPRREQMGAEDTLPRTDRPIVVKLMLSCVDVIVPASLRTNLARRKETIFVFSFQRNGTADQRVPNRPTWVKPTNVCQTEVASSNNAERNLWDVRASPAAYEFISF